MSEKSVIINTPSICRNYPDVIRKEISRDYLLDTIDKMFEEKPVVILEGEEGAGKTSLLAQYGRRNPNNTISCFINPYSKFGYSPDWVRLILAEQLNWIITKKYETFDSVDTFNYSKLLFRIERMAINKKVPYVFIIDGIDDIPEDDKTYVNVILREMLPIGQPWLKFLFTGASSSSYSPIEGISIPWRVPPFSVPEVREYFSDLNITPEQLEQIRSMCRSGVPGRLASVRRLLQSGISIQEIIESNPKAVPDFIKLEFKNIDASSLRLSNILAILAFSFSRFTITDIAALLKDEDQNTEKDIAECPVLQIEPMTKIVSFISNPHREFARTQFMDRKQWSIDTIIEYLKGHNGNIHNLTELPVYLKHANRYDELLNQLTHDHFATLVMKTETISPLISQIDLGLNASMTLNRSLSIFNYAILKSLSLGLGGIDTSYSEIHARLALGETEEAIALANNSVLKEDRLRLMSFIARYIYEHGLKAEESLKAQISMLAKQIDFSAPGSDASVVAANLIWSDPDLAISILEKATEKRSDRDIEFARLSMMAQATEPIQGVTDHLIQKTTSKIQNPKMQDFISRAKVFFGKCEPSEVIDRLKDSEFKTKLFCLKKWSETAQSCKNPEIVLNFALDEMIKNTAYLPKIKDLSDLAQQLPNIENKDQAKLLVTRFDSMIASVEQFGSSQDITDIQILLAKAEKKYDEKAFTDRIIVLFLEVTKIPDLAAKTECFAMIKAALSELDPAGIIEKKEKLQSCIDDELETSVAQLLQGSADHFESLIGTINILSISHPNIALEIIERMNTQSRRNQAYYELAKGMLKNSVTSIDFKILLKIVRDCVFKNTGWDLLVHLFAKAFDEKANMEPNVLAALKTFADMIDNVKAAKARCYASCYAYALYKTANVPGYDVLISKLENLMKDSFSSIEPSWEKTEVGNLIAINLALSESDKAREYLSIVKSIAGGSPIGPSKSVNIHMMLLHLAIRSYPGLFSDKSDKEQFAIVEHLIGLIPSLGEQIELWGILAMEYYAKGKKEFADILVKKHIWPALEHFPVLEETFKAEIVKRIAPALYYYHPSTALGLITTLLDEYQDSALYQICDYILTKTPWTEPVEVKTQHGFKLDYTEATDICSILEKIKTDMYIYYILERLVESVISKSGKYNINDIQRRTIRDRLVNIVNNKLPDNDNIKHEGFKIIAEAQVMRIEKQNQSDWIKLMDRATAIPNTADRTYIFVILASCMPSNLIELRAGCINKAFEEAELIPAYMDKIDRYLFIAEQIQYIDESLARTALKNAMKISISAEDPDAVFSVQRQIIDKANKLSTEFAEEVANIFDCDPARMKARIDSLTEEPERIKARYDLHNYLKFLKEQNDVPVNDSVKKKNEPDDDRVAEAASKWLAALNGDLINPIHLEKTHDYLTIASRLPLEQSYPIYLWFIANLTKRIESTQGALGLIEPLFNSLVAVSNFALSVHSKTRAQIKRLHESYASGNIETENVVIETEDHTKVINFIQNWLSEELKEYLYICDPYFKKDDLEYIKLVSSIKNDCQVYVIMGPMKDNAVQISTMTEFQSEWKKISQEEPLPTEFISVSLTNGKPPFHDRFWLTQGSGLNFGTSLGGIGLPRKSHISVMRMEEYEKWNEEVNPFIGRRRNCNGQIVKYFSFSL